MFFRKTTSNNSSSGGNDAASHLTPSQAEERRLIERSRKGDLDAFDRLVRQYERHVYGTAYRLCGTHDDASDIAQEAFVRAWNNLKSFRGDSAFSTWLYRIVTNVFLDDRKRKRNRQHQSLDDDLNLDESSVQRQYEDPSPGPQELAEGDERRLMIERAIQTLPEAQRAMVILYHTQGLSYEEIAEITQLPMGTVKSRLNRARLALRDRLAPVAELFGVPDSPM